MQNIDVSLPLPLPLTFTCPLLRPSAWRWVIAEHVDELFLVCFIYFISMASQLGIKSAVGPESDLSLPAESIKSARI
jgi:hypothetical protein